MRLLESLKSITPKPKPLEDGGAMSEREERN